MPDKDPESPETTGLAYDAMVPSWIKIQTLLDGTSALRAAEREYLPQHANEEDTAYLNRLAVSVLFNLTKITLDSWVGRPFSDPIGFDSVPAKLEPILDDVDLVGTDIHVFAQQWFKDGLSKAYSHVLVDHPRIDTDAPRTLADDIAENVRPYWVHIRPEQMFFADAEIINGQEVLREVRIMEQVHIRDGFAEVMKDQIRRIFMAVVAGTEGEPLIRPHVELWQKQKKTPRSRKEVWKVVDNYFMDIDRIPLVTFYSDRDAFMIGKPPLEDLVDLNLAHWQSASDQRNILTVTRFPMLAQSGGSDDDSEMPIGPRRWMYDSNPQSKFYYVEHTGAAIGAGRQDMEDLVTQMAEYGAEFLKKRPTGQTATARALDSAEATSSLQDTTMRFGHAMSQALFLTAKWMKLDGGGTATMSTDFGPEEVDQAELNTLNTARAQRDLSLQTYLEELLRRGLLPDTLKVEEEITRIEDEALRFNPVPIEPLEKEEPGETKPGETKPDVVPA